MRYQNIGVAVVDLSGKYDEEGGVIQEVNDEECKTVISKVYGDIGDFESTITWKENEWECPGCTCEFYYPSEWMVEQVGDVKRAVDFSWLGVITGRCEEHEVDSISFGMPESTKHGVQL